eukprot:356314-Chlamydomonas_euryale.AAC.2
MSFGRGNGTSRGFKSRGHGAHAAGGTEVQLGPSGALAASDRSVALSAGWRIKALAAGHRRGALSAGHRACRPARNLAQPRRHPCPQRHVSVAHVERPALSRRRLGARHRRHERFKPGARRQLQLGRHQALEHLRQTVGCVGTQLLTARTPGRTSVQQPCPPQRFVPMSAALPTLRSNEHRPPNAHEHRFTNAAFQ